MHQPALASMPRAPGALEAHKPGRRRRIALPKHLSIHERIWLRRVWSATRLGKKIRTFFPLTFRTRSTTRRRMSSIRARTRQRILVWTHQGTRTWIQDSTRAPMRWRIRVWIQGSTRAPMRWRTRVWIQGSTLAPMRWRTRVPMFPSTSRKTRRRHVLPWVNTARPPHNVVCRNRARPRVVAPFVRSARARVCWTTLPVYGIGSVVLAFARMGFAHRHFASTMGSIARTTGIVARTFVTKGYALLRCVMRTALHAARMNHVVRTIAGRGERVKTRLVNRSGLHALCLRIAARFIAIQRGYAMSNAPHLEAHVLRTRTAVRTCANKIAVCLPNALPTGSIASMTHNAVRFAATKRIRAFLEGLTVSEIPLDLEPLCPPVRFSRPSS
mgnify:FL=1